MAKKPAQVSMYRRAVDLAKRNPISTVAALFTIFVGMPGAVAAYDLVIEPSIPTLRYWVRSHVADALKPVLVTQNQQGIALDRYLLYNVKKDLDAAKRDPAAATSPTAQERVDELERQKAETEHRICKAEGRTNCGKEFR